MTGEPPKPLFPQRVEEPPPHPPEAAGFDVEMATRIERTVSEVFTQRLGAQSMPYTQARALAWLERDVIGALIAQFAKAPTP